MEETMSPTEMVGHLTERNLMLEDQLKQRTRERDHLEEMVQLNEEIAEEAKSCAKEAKQQCDAYAVQLAENAQEYQAQQSRLGEYEAIIQQLRQKVADMSDEIMGYKEQMDAAMESSKIIEHLTEQNIDLEDQLKKRTKERDHLEEMVQLNEEIVEEAKKYELEVRQQCDAYIVQLSENTREYHVLETRLSEYEAIIQRFRQKVSDMNDEIIGYKDQMEILHLQLNDQASSGAQVATALFTANRAFSDVISAELNTIELKYLLEQNRYLRDFLPDNFSKAGGDMDSVLLTVFFPRMAEKSNLLAKLLGERYPEVPGGMKREHAVFSHKAEQWAYVRKFRYELQFLTETLNRFASVAKNCTTESLQRLAMQRIEMTNQEKIIDQYFELMKQNRLDENTSIENLERSALLFQRILFTNVSATQYDTRSAMEDFIQRFVAGLDWLNFNLARFQHFLLPNESSNNVIEELCNDLTATGAGISSSLVRARKSIPTDHMLDLSHDILDIIFGGFGALERICQFLHRASALAVSQLTTNVSNRPDGTGDDVEGFSVAELSEFLQSTVEKTTGQKSVVQALDEIRSSLNTVKSAVDDIAVQLESHKLERPLPVDRTSPLAERSTARKQDTVEGESLRWQLSRKDEEILRLSRLVRDLNDTQCALKIRLEREQKKSSEIGQSESAVLSEKFEKELKEKAEKYDAEISSLKSDVEKAVRSRDELQKRLDSERAKTASATLLDGGLSATSSKLPLPSNAGQTPELERSLLWAQDRIRRLQAELDTNNLLALKPLKIPERACGPETLRVQKHSSGSPSTLLQRFYDEGKLLVLEEKNLRSMPEERRHSHAYREHAIEYNNRVIDLECRLKAFFARYYPHVVVPSTAPLKARAKTTSAMNTSFNDLRNKVANIQKNRAEVLKRIQCEV